MSASIVFLGATGGCVSACLVRTLAAKKMAIALVRDPAKLYGQLSDKGVSRELMKHYLTVTQGDVRDLDTVKKVLTPGSGIFVERIVSGVGGTPIPQLNLLCPLALPEGDVCHLATQNILHTLSDLWTEAQACGRKWKKPLICVISANGVLDREPRDYPLPLAPLYRWVLRAVYDDKRGMEDLLVQDMRRSTDEAITAACIIVRPSMLSDGPAKGIASIQEGTTSHPTQGWRIAREDVGTWLFERVVKLVDIDRLNCGGVTITT